MAYKKSISRTHELDIICALSSLSKMERLAFISENLKRQRRQLERAQTKSKNDNKLHGMSNGFQHTPPNQSRWMTSYEVVIKFATVITSAFKC